LGRVYSQGAVRTVDSSGFTFPSTPAGHFVQHRNLLEAELAHDVDALVPRRPRWLRGVAYRLRYKGVYEGLYDYGPDEYSEQEEVVPPSPFGPSERRTVNRTATNRQVLGVQNELWNAYAQASAGPLFARLGRQDLSWGETDGFRLLDMIEPLDNRFGFPLVEDLDDRRIPLWMARANVALPWRSRAVSNVTLEGFLVPGSIEEQEAPLSPRGSPFAAPAPPSFLGRVVTRPPANMRGSRGGGRLLGTVRGNTTVSLAHYVTWNDAPAVRLRVLGVDLVDGAPQPEAALEFAFYRQQITGGSLTTQISRLDAVLRAEAATFWDERVFDVARAGLGPRFPEVVGEAIADRLAGGRGTAAGGFTRKDVFRWVLGFDRFQWVRAVNPTNVFSTSAQIFHTHILDHDDGIRNGILDPATRGFVARKEDEITLTLLVSTLFWRGRLAPQVFAAYDPRGVFSAVPGITWLVGTHVRVTAKYAFLDGEFVNLGFFRDRDELLLRIEASL
ncbi:MAG: DUF1302 family protein, partial [Candidatus Binatia bacterium]